MRWLREDQERRLDLVEGVVPLILTFAHAGRQFVDEIDGGRADPGLSDCGFNGSRNDTRTREVAEAMLEHMEWCGLRPYVVVPWVSRRDIDLNRSWEHNRRGYELGGLGQDVIDRAAVVYDGFYDTVAAFIQRIQTRFTGADVARAILIDIHGTGLSEGVDIEIGTRNRRSADSALVYETDSDTLSILDALQGQDFALRADAATNTALEGCEVINRFGLRGDGLHAIQFELSSTLRGADGDTNEERVSLARATGLRLALALETILVENDYPTDADPAEVSDDTDNYVALMLARS